MQDFIISVVLNSFMCWGVRLAFMDGNIFYPIRKAYEKIDHPVAYEIAQPIWGCVKCMASVWGIVFLLSVGTQNVTGQPFLSPATAVYIFALCGLNFLTTIYLGE